MTLTASGPPCRRALPIQRSRSPPQKRRDGHRQAPALRRIAKASQALGPLVLRKPGISSPAVVHACRGGSTLIFHNERRQTCDICRGANFGGDVWARIINSV